MEFQERHISIKKTARYYIAGDLSKKTRNLLIACHGYAQLASDFIKDFQPLVNEGITIAAPEGLSRFYTRGFFGKVGATWMTKEDRLNEIEDYTNYLQDLYLYLRSQCHDDVKMSALGFSQGCATITRWAAQKTPKLDQLWICSGDIPDDLDWPSFSNYSNNCDIGIVYGEDDPFIREGDLARIQKKISDKQVKLSVHTFKGDHVINPDILIKNWKK